MDAELARRDGVELVRTGSWPAMTGSWSPTRDDLSSAIEALKCPAVRRPVLKVGHLDDRFTAAKVGDGEPAIGWVDNLRLSDGGHTLVGDYVGMPAWIGQIMASAWPDRSIEGDYNYRCTLSHTHPFALKAVALLGVTPPGVGTLKSLQDVATLYGVNVAASDLGAGEHVQVTIRAAADVHTGAMVALIPTADDAARLAVDGGEPPEQLHVTLAYLGEAADLGAQGQQDVIDAASSAVNGLPTVEADIFSVNVFNPVSGNTPADARDRDTCLVWGLSGDEIDAVHDMVTAALAGVESPDQHQPWHAHMTAEYTDDLSLIPTLAERVGPVTFDRVRIAFGGQIIDIPLIEYDEMDLDDSGEYDGGDWADDPDPVAASAADDKGAGGSNLKTYFTKNPKGLARWADSPHPWTALYNLISQHVDPDRAKRIAAQWYHDVFGKWPGSKGVHASEGKDATSMPSRAELVRAAWNNSGAPVQKWVQEARPDAAVVVDDTDPANRSYELYPVMFDGDQVSFGAPQPYDPAADRALVFASAAESRPGDPPPDPAPADTQKPPTEAASSILPAAEPEPITDPKEEDPVSTTDLSAFRSRLGLDDTADEAAITAAIDALKVKAETPEATPEMVAASAAAETEKDELRKEVQVLASQVKTVTTELAATKAEKAATVKASVFDAAIKDGKIKPADRETWETDYDQAPAAVTRVLASIAVGTAVPVLASGIAGSPEPHNVDEEYEALVAALDAPKAV